MHTHTWDSKKSIILAAAETVCLLGFAFIGGSALLLLGKLSDRAAKYCYH